MIEAGLPGKAIIENGIVQCQRTANAIARELQDEDFQPLIKAIYAFLFSLSTNTFENIRQYLKPFLFQFADHRQEFVEETFDDDEGGEGPLDSSEGVESGNLQHESDTKSSQVVMSTVSFLKAVASAALLGMKYSLVMYIVTRWEQVEIELSSRGETSLLNPLCELDGIFKTDRPPNSMVIATMLADLNRANAASPSVVNVCYTRTGESGEFIVVCGEGQFDLYAFQQTGNYLFRSLFACFKACFYGNDQLMRAFENAVMDVSCRDLAILKGEEGAFDTFHA